MCLPAATLELVIAFSADLDACISIGRSDGRHARLTRRIAATAIGIYGRA
jgi:hypothetical protein